MTFVLKQTPHFRRRAKKILKHNKALQVSLQNTLVKLIINPFDTTLNTHLVTATIGKRTVYSSRITNDIRLIWHWNKNEFEAIDLLDLGGHSGNKKVYK